MNGDTDPIAAETPKGWRTFEAKPFLGRVQLLFAAPGAPSSDWGEYRLSVVAARELATLLQEAAAEVAFEQTNSVDSPPQEG
jgi:hypothetical protein